MPRIPTRSDKYWSNLVKQKTFSCLVHLGLDPAGRSWRAAKWSQNPLRSQHTSKSLCSLWPTFHCVLFCVQVEFWLPWFKILQDPSRSFKVQWAFTWPENLHSDPRASLLRPSLAMESMSATGPSMNQSVRSPSCLGRSWSMLIYADLKPLGSTWTAWWTTSVDVNFWRSWHFKNAVLVNQSVFPWLSAGSALGSPNCSGIARYSPRRSLNVTATVESSYSKEATSDGTAAQDQTGIANHWKEYTRHLPYSCCVLEGQYKLFLKNNTSCRFRYVVLNFRWLNTRQLVLGRSVSVLFHIYLQI